MLRLKLVVITVLAIRALCAAEDKGYCPPSPTPNTMTAPKKAAPPTSFSPDKKYFGTVTLLTAITDKGFVCAAWVLQGVSNEIDAKTEKAVREWHFEPARKDGHAVPVVVRVNVNYWTTSAGEIVSDPPKSEASPSSKKVANKSLQ